MSTSEALFTAQSSLTCTCTLLQRRAQVALKGKFKEEIYHLMSVGVLEKVEEPTSGCAVQ